MKGIRALSELYRGELPPANTSFDTTFYSNEVVNTFIQNKCNQTMLQNLESTKIRREVLSLLAHLA